MDCKCLEGKNIKFQITGGLAAKIYGSLRELTDIDIEISTDRFEDIMPEIKDKIIFGPERYKDENWDLFMATIQYEGQDIDICAANTEKIFNQNTKQWEKLEIDFSKTIKKEYLGVSVQIIPLDKLISYKSKVQREVDIEDVKFLSGPTS